MKSHVIVNKTTSAITACITSTSTMGLQMSHVKLDLKGCLATGHCIATGIRPVGRVYASDNYNTGSRVGSEYGEGFTVFTRTGERTRLDVDRMNESMKVRGADRMRFSMHPDQAFGLLYDLDALMDVGGWTKGAWVRVASRHGYPCEDMRDRVYDGGMMAERAILEVLRWTDDIKVARALAFEVYEAIEDTDGTRSSVYDDAVGWVELTTQEFKIPSALVTTMSRKAVTGLLGEGVVGYFDGLVTGEDDMETTSLQYLAAALKIGRAPEQCVVFCTSQDSIVAAHNCSMRAVGVIGRCSAHQLRGADLTVGSLKELSVYNIRRLFANKGGGNFMDLEKKFDDRVGQDSGRRVRHATDEGE